MKNVKGITLIALVITIIILLILTGITIASLSNTGLFDKSREAEAKNRYQTAKEIVNLKLLDVRIYCETSNAPYNIEEIEEQMYKDNKIQIEVYYNQTASLKLKNGTNERKNTSAMVGIVVSATEYPEYDFLIGKKGSILAVSTKGDEVGIGSWNGEEENLPDGFKEVKTFEKENIKIKVDFNNSDKNEEKLEYIITNQVESNDDSHIIQDGFKENSTSQWGTSAWFQAFDGNESTYSSTIATGNETIGSWIGYDFEKSVYVSSVSGKIRMKGYKIQYADNIENQGNWKDAIENTSNGSENGDSFYEDITEDKPHRYWRLYVNAGQKNSDWGPNVWELNFEATNKPIIKIKSEKQIDNTSGNIIQNGFKENSTSQWGTSAWFQAFDEDEETYTSTIATGNETIGSWIGYDFKEPIYISNVNGKIRMKGYKIQYADNIGSEENWKDAIENTSSGSGDGNALNEYIAEEEPHRYWRLYVNAEQTESDWSACVWELKFNGYKLK